MLNDQAARATELFQRALQIDPANQYAQQGLQDLIKEKRK